MTQTAQTEKVVPIIDVSEMHLPTIADQAADAIDAGNVPPALFRYGDLVRSG